MLNIDFPKKIGAKGNVYSINKNFLAFFLIPKEIIFSAFYLIWVWDQLDELGYLKFWCKQFD